MERISAFKTSDGLVFTDQSEADQHEKALRDVRVFLIEHDGWPWIGDYYTKGIGYKETYVMIRAESQHELIAELYACENFGARVRCVNYLGPVIIESWRIREVPKTKIECDAQAVDHIEMEKPLLWEDSVIYKAHPFL